MSAFSRQFSSASPVLAITPRPSHQESLAMAAFAHPHMPVSGHLSSSTLHPTSLYNGRKRRRDDAAANLEPDYPSSSVQAQEDWVYGEGMMLKKPGVGYVPDASSQSGTWVEERDSIREVRAKESAEVIGPRCSKSQRMNIDSRDEILVSTPATAVSSVSNASVSVAQDPVIDDFTLHLGIGWRRIGHENHIQAAARGWARFIENHYPLSNVNIRLESKGLQSYLVETSQGFYLFSDDLRRARLVSRDVNGAIRNLQRTPPSFEGTETLLRTDSPRPSEKHAHAPTDAVMTD